MISKKQRRTIVVDGKEWYYKIRRNYDNGLRIIVCDPLTGDVRVTYPDDDPLTPSLVANIIRDLWNDKDKVWFA